MIPNLKKLEIDCSHYKKGTYLKNLAYLFQLEKLILLCSDSYNAGWPLVGYPRMLKKLTLKRMLLPWDEMTVVGSLPNLQVLKLMDFACKDRTWETSQGGFPQLEYLLIQDSCLEDWITESSHFPSLKRLVLRHCRYLRNIPDGIGEIPTLELIHIKCHVEKSLEESVKRIQEEQQDWGNDALKLSDVAAYADSSRPLNQMHLMDADKSWNLLKQRVFTHKACLPESEDTGKEIARVELHDGKKIASSVVAEEDGQFEEMLIF
ncbi:hypothetical protein ACS0TY_005037 [Phlomoides rotata]